MKHFILLCLLQFGLYAESNQFLPVFEEHVTSLHHLEVAHPPSAIAFSATPGMGKTTIANELEKRLQGVRLSSDTARKLLRKHGINPNAIDPTTKQTAFIAYMAYFLQEHVKRSVNHLIIFDMSVDRQYSLLAAHSKNLFVIRLVVPRPVVEERIRKREDTPDAYLKHMDKWFSDYDAFDEKRVNFFFDNTNDFEKAQLVRLIQALKLKFHR